MFGNVKFDFNYDPVQIGYDSISMNFSYTDVCLSDSSGKLLFYCNGVYVANATDEIIQNGDSINAGYVEYVWDPGLATYGNQVPRGILALPSVSVVGQYYLIHSFLDTIPGQEGADVSKILTTLVDMNANNGQGKVLYKNEQLLSGSLSESLSATRHGNGRDWWLLVQKDSTNFFYQILLDSSGCHVTDSSYIGVAMPIGGQDQSCFSPDGTKFLYYGLGYGLSVFDFDRCTGTLSNPQYLPQSVVNDTGSGALGISVSPDSRFLYLGNEWKLLQLDLWSSNLQASIDTVAVLDGWQYGVPYRQNYFETSQLAPDGKIYIACGDVPVINIIDSPSVKGTGCHVIQHYPIGELAWCLPNYPNYRLGALTESQ
jgi:hypothetical protein